MLTLRQVELLTAIINEYVKSSSPVGSEILVTKYNIKYSPATVRNEMAKLLDEGFLEMLHTSSGRIPTPMAYRYFLTEVMKEDEVPVLQEVAMKQRLWPHRYNFERMLYEGAKALSDLTKELTLVTTNEGYVIHAGEVNLLDYQEFWDINAAKTVFYLLDRYDLLDQVFKKAAYGDDVKYLIGDELGDKNMDLCGMVFSEYSTGSKSGHVAVIGPARMQYSEVIPAVRYTKNLIEELSENW